MNNKSRIADSSEYRKKRADVELTQDHQLPSSPQENIGDSYMFNFFKTEELPPYKVLLVKTAIKHPINDEDFGVPIGLYVLKDYLKTTGHNLEVDIWDERLALKECPREKYEEPKQNNILFENELKKNYDAVGISMCTSEVPPAIEKFNIVRKKYPNIITFCGGIFTASNEKCLLDTGVIDYVIPGIATKPLGDLLVKLYNETKKEHDAGKINTTKNIDVYGVAHFKNRNDFKSVWTCSQLPTMQLSAWTEIDKKYKKHLNEKIGIYTARGCDKGCLFCSVQRESKRTIFRKSEDCVINEIIFLTQMGYTYFSIKDEDFSLDDVRMKNILKEVSVLSDKKVQFKIRARYDNAQELIAKDKNLLKELKNLGVDEIQYGIETFDKNIRDNVKKHYEDICGKDIDNKTAIVKFIKEHADNLIKANCSFILGLRGETISYYAELEQFFKEISTPHKDYLKIYLNYLTPHPYNSEFSLKTYRLINNDLNFFTHRYPVCYDNNMESPVRGKMLETHNEIAKIFQNTGGRDLNPVLENGTLKTSFCNGINDREATETSKLNLLNYLKQNTVKGGI